jgi:hypothetical protein
MSRLSLFLRHRLNPLKAAARHVPPLHQAGFPVTVCWSAKAGCTTMLKWFLHHTGLLGAAEAFHEWPHEYRQKVLMRPLDGYMARCTTALRRGDTQVIKVVRDPARRAVSSYLQLIRMGEEGLGKLGVASWKKRVGLGRQAGLSFEQFLRFVIDTRSAGAPLEVHMQSQHQPSWDDFVERVITLENLAVGLADIEQVHGLPRTDLPRFSASPHHNPAHDGEPWPHGAARFPATCDSLRDLGTPPAQALLDEHTVRLVRLAYEADYAAFGHLYAEPSRAAENRTAEEKQA